MRKWSFNNRRDCNRFREMLAAQGIVTAVKTRGMLLHVTERNEATDEAREALRVHGVRLGQ